MHGSSELFDNIASADVFSAQRVERLTLDGLRINQRSVSWVLTISLAVVGHEAVKVMGNGGVNVSLSVVEEELDSENEVVELWDADDVSLGLGLIERVCVGLEREIDFVELSEMVVVVVAEADASRDWDSVVENIVDVDADTVSVALLLTEIDIDEDVVTVGRTLNEGE